MYKARDVMEELGMFDTIDFNNFWKESDYISEVCTGENLTDEMVQYAEQRLGYKFPESYIVLMKTRNGGKPLKTVWFDEKNRYRVDVEEIFSISEEKNDSLFGTYGNEFWYEEWEYPRDIGVIIADTISGGHEMIYLDYRDCGKNGEPKVSLCSAEDDHEIIVLADSFEEFILGLTPSEELKYQNM